MTDPNPLALSCSIEPPIGPGRRLLRYSARTACFGWTAIAVMCAAFWPFAISSYVALWLLDRMGVA